MVLAALLATAPCARPVARQVNTIMLGNKIGDEGKRALAEALPYARMSYSDEMGEAPTEFMRGAKCGPWEALRTQTHA